MEKTSTTSTTKRRTDNRTLQNFLVEELRELYGAEKQLVRFLPELEKSARSQPLSIAFAEHVEVTEAQLTRIERIFELLKENSRSKKCEGMEGLVKECQTLLELTEEANGTRDIALILAAQKILHYKIASYTLLARLAKAMDQVEVANFFNETWNEEKQADALLTSLAENVITQETRLSVTE